ncbi:hypothetical protein [Salinicoccus sp. CNSTN-B1]
MMEMNRNWLPHLSAEIVAEVEGIFLDAYVVALEGWRRGLKLRWHVKDSEHFKDMETWSVDRPGQLFSLSSKDRTHYFFRSRGDKVTNEAVLAGKDKHETKVALTKAGVPCRKADSLAPMKRMTPSCSMQPSSAIPSC